MIVMEAIVVVFALGFVGILGWILFRAAVSGEIGLNLSVYRRKYQPVMFWFTVVLACGMLFMVLRGLFHILVAGD